MTTEQNLLKHFREVKTRKAPADRAEWSAERAPSRRCALDQRRINFRYVDREGNIERGESQPSGTISAHDLRADNGIAKSLAVSQMNYK